MLPLEYRRKYLRYKYLQTPTGKYDRLTCFIIAITEVTSPSTKLVLTVNDPKGKQLVLLVSPNHTTFNDHILIMLAYIG